MTDTIYQPQYAKGFEIYSDDSDDSIKLINILNPWQGAKDISRPLIILPENIENYNVNDRNSEPQIIKGVPQRIVCMSSTQVAMLEELGMADKIVGVSLIDYISSDYVKKNKDKLVDVGYEGNIDYEKLISTNPDLVLLYGINGVNPMEPKLKELQIPYMYVGDYLEESPLGKAEWLVALGEVMGVGALSQRMFRKIPENYNNYKELVNSTGLSKPKVMLNMPYQDFWYMPPKNSYMVKLIEDAGGYYILNDYPDKLGTDSRSVTIDMEEALQMCNQSDVWLNVGPGLGNKNEMINTLPKFNETSILKTGLIFNNTKRSTPGGGNDFYESGVLHPDLILRDLIHIFHPDLSSDSLIYYKEIK